MLLEKYEDFFDLSIKDLTNYLAVRGLNTSGRKVELVARALAAFELKMIIIASSEEQLSLGNIFAYILEKKCATRNILDARRTKKHIHIGIADSLVLFTYMKHVLKKIMCFYTLQLKHHKL